jgi:Uma2 family endonuclease
VLSFSHGQRHARFRSARAEYLDGRVVERHLGSIPHSAAQGRMLEFFDPLKQSSKLFGYPAVTMSLSPSRYRIADVAVFSGCPPAGKMYPTDPPEFAVEIVSKEDCFVEIQEKLMEYHTWGIKYVWLVDPWNRKFFVYDASGFNEVPTFDLPEYNAKISVAEFFAD